MFLLLSFAAINIADSYGQNVDDIINKHINAIGGKGIIGGIKSIFMQTTVHAMGMDAPSSISLLNGKGIRIESDINGDKMITVYTDKYGWNVNPMSAVTAPQQMKENQYKLGRDQIDIGGPLFNYETKGYKVELLKKDDSAYLIKVINKDNIATIFFINSPTYLITKSIQQGLMRGKETEIINTFSDFQKADNGLVYPSKTEVNYWDQFSIITYVTKIEIDKDIDPKIFEMPR